MRRLFLKKKLTRKISIDIPLTIFPARLMSFSRCFSKIAIYKNRFSCSGFPDNFPHAELQSFSEWRTLAQLARPEMSFFGLPHRIKGLKIAKTLETRSPQNMFLHTGVDLYP